MAEDSQYLVSYGPDSNCTLAICPVEWSVYQYRPSLGANTAFIVLFGLAMIIHIVLGIKWRSWAFLFAMFWGCVSELIGYGGRVMLWQNPFSFSGFLMQICCITLGPAFYSAGIYLTFIIYLGPEHARFSPKLYYWIFIICDIFSLILQAVGGALSSTSEGGSKVAVDVAIAGLSFQVFTLCVFIGLAIEYAVRYLRARGTQPRNMAVSGLFKVFVVGLTLSIVCILIRCVYRIDELSDGYNGPLIRNEPLFIGLEGVMIAVAVYALVIAHPGPVFGLSERAGYDGDDSNGMDKVTDKSANETALEEQTP